MPTNGYRLKPADPSQDVKLSNKGDVNLALGFEVLAHSGFVISPLQQDPQSCQNLHHLTERLRSQANPVQIQECPPLLMSTAGSI